MAPRGPSKTSTLVRFGDLSWADANRIERQQTGAWRLAVRQGAMRHGLALKLMQSGETGAISSHMLGVS
jgi:hypothetical protein